ncbi:MAG TPA: hypothetical protein VI456_12810, partial [Polyangia bacterium]
GAAGSSSGGKTGAAGSAAGGTTGTGGKGGTGVAGTTGAGGGAAGACGSAAGTSGSAGTTGAAGMSGYTCPLGGVLDCSSAGAMKVPDGLITDFSTPQWNMASGKWCDADGLRGSLFAYSGPATTSTSAAVVDTTAQNLKLNVTVAAMGYAGGGVSFDSCVNAAAFTSVQFTATLTAGSLAGCSWQVQVQTQDERPSNATSPSGGTCNPDAGASCYRYPAVANLALPTATATTYAEPFTTFSNPASSPIMTRTQVIGVQWQVNSASSGTGTCTAELRIDNVTFQ